MADSHEPIRSEPELVRCRRHGGRAAPRDRSADGERIPYFVIKPRGLRGQWQANPTLIGAYGGFEVARTPFYSGLIGNNWLASGGVYVLANIRGGGEFGPRWHQAALRENRSAPSMT
jgi:prolyl oligopeptidase